MDRIDPVVKVSEPGRTPLHVVVRQPMELGRDCAGVLLGDAELSRRHLRVSATAGRVSVQDLGSTNGTTLNGDAIVGPVNLAPGDVVAFGQCTLEVTPAAPGAALVIVGHEPGGPLATDNEVEHNWFDANTLDLLVTSVGTGNEVEHNRCSTSEPDGLCQAQHHGHRHHRR